MNYDYLGDNNQHTWIILWLKPVNKPTETTDSYKAKNTNVWTEKVFCGTM